MERGQFTFYKSFYESICRIRRKQDKADAYDAICRYALFGEAPDPEKIPDIVAVAFINAKPNLDSSRKKAASGKKGGESKQPGSNLEANGSKPEANASKRKQTPSEKEIEKENEKEIEIEGENDKRSSAPLPDSDFEAFWAAYPRQYGREKALSMWREKTAGVPLSDILSALDRWKACSQWTEDGGRYIPKAVSWLEDEYWKSPPTLPKKAPCGACGELGEAELEAIQQLMREG